MCPIERVAVGTACVAADAECVAVGTKARRSRHKVRACVTPHTPHAAAPAETRARSDAGRWAVVVALLLSPDRESRRLARLLDRLPGERHRYEIADDVKRRRWAE